MGLPGSQWLLEDMETVSSEKWLLEGGPCSSGWSYTRVHTDSLDGGVWHGGTYLKLPSFKRQRHMDL